MAILWNDAHPAEPVVADGRVHAIAGLLNVHPGPNLSAARELNRSRCLFQPTREFSHVDDDPRM
jgi:hypothetical protein